MVTFVDSPLRCLEILEKHGSLASPVKDQISSLKKELRFLRTFLIYPAKAIPCGWISSVEAIIKNSTVKLASACAKPTKRVDHVVSAMLEKVKIYKPEIRKSYLILSEQQRREEEPTAALDSNHSRWLNRRAFMDFVGSVLENLEDILVAKEESSVAVLKIKFGSLKEKLSFLRNFLSIFLENHYSSSSLQVKMISLLDNSVHMATTSACLSYLFWVGDEMDPEMNSKLSDLLHKKIKPRTSHDLDMYLGLLKAAASLKAAKVSRNHDEEGPLKAATSSSTAAKGSKDNEGLLEEASSISAKGSQDVIPTQKASSSAAKGSEKDKMIDTVAKGRGVGSTLPPRRRLVKMTFMAFEKLTTPFRLRASTKGSEDDEGLLKASTEGSKDDERLPKASRLLKTSTEGSKDDERLLKASTEGSKDDEGLLKASMREQASGNEKNDEVAEFVKFLLDNSLDSIISDQIDSLRKELEYLIAFLMDLPDNCWGDLFWISSDIKSAAIKAASFHHVDDLSELEAEKNQISDLLKEIYLLKARVILRRLDNSSKDGLMVPMKDELKPLVQVLEFLQSLSFDPPKKKQAEEKLLLSHAEIVSKGLKSLIYSIHETELTKEVVMKMKLSLSWLLAKIYLINAELKLIELRSQKANLVSNMVDQIGCLHEELRFLRTFLMDNMDIEANIGDQKLLLTHLEAVYSLSFSLISSFLYNEMATESSVSLPRLLGHIKLVKAEAILVEHRTHQIGLMGPMKDLFQELGFFITFLYYPRPSWMYEEKKELILSKSKAVANEAASLIFLFRNDMKRGDMANEFSKLIDKIVHLKPKIKEIFLQIPESLHSNLPMMTNGLNLISSLLEDMRKLLKCEPSSISSVKHVIKMLDSGFESLKGFLLFTAEQHNDDEEIKDLCTYISHVVYEAEYMIDSFVVKVEFVWHFMLWVYFALEDITFAKEKVKEIQKENKFDTKYCSVTKTSFHVPPQATDELLVELEDQKEIIIDCLTQGRVDLDIIAIVGMPGLGKTTLAKEVYDCPSVSHSFHIRAWCRLSQVYDPREVLLNILGHIAGITGSIHEMTYDKLQEQLYEFLKGIRYLVIIDELWDINQWDKLKGSFPNDDNGSRILVTCRTSNLVCQAKPDSFVHSLQLFSDLESWKFLEKKVFYPDACPPTLQEVGKQISSHCRGLPIAISMIGGLLANTERRLDWWEEVEKNLSYGNFIVDPYMHVLEFCYEQLPPHLKPCFLYFAAFPEGKEIPVWKLFRLWVAEGFVQKTESQMLEDVAEGYLLDLINRNLVIIAKRRSVGGVKKCLVHELLWEFCIAKAKDEKFMQLMQQYGEFSTTCHRLCICSTPEQFVMSKPSDPCVRCLLFFASNGVSPRQPSDISFISQKFQLLRVLNLEGIIMSNSFLTALEILVLLRYLALRGSVYFVPSSIANLSKLETFIVMRNRHAYEVALPSTFWSMRRLRHVHIKNIGDFSLQNCEFEDSSQLDNMQTLSCPILCCGKHTEKILRRLPNLRKLKCIFGKYLASSRECNDVPAFELLTHLESLNITYWGKIRYSSMFDFPYNLKKLSLSRCRLPWMEMSTIGRLTNLEVLKLLDRAFEGQHWEIRKGEFLKLKYLKLEDLDIVLWFAGYDSFPCLQQLVLQRCKKLEEVPSSFRDIVTLQSIEVICCNFSAGISAMKIQEEQQIMGNKKLKVLINL